MIDPVITALLPDIAVDIELFIWVKLTASWAFEPLAIPVIFWPFIGIGAVIKFVCDPSNAIKFYFAVANEIPEPIEST